MHSDEFPGLCPPMQRCRINFRDGTTHREDSITPNNIVIIRMIRCPSGRRHAQGIATAKGIVTTRITITI
jgi:hypothetical protein